MNRLIYVMILGVLSLAFVGGGVLAGGVRSANATLVLVMPVTHCTCKVIRPAGQVGKVEYQQRWAKDAGEYWFLHAAVPGWGIIYDVSVMCSQNKEIGWWDNIAGVPVKGVCKEDCETTLKKCGLTMTGTFHCNFNPSFVSSLEVKGTFGTDETIRGGQQATLFAKGYKKCNTKKWGEVTFTVGDGAALRAPFEEVTYRFKCKKCEEDGN